MRNISTLLLFAFTALAQSTEPPPVKVGVIEWQKAIMSTQEGQRSAAALQAQFEPRRLDVEGKRIQVEALQERLRRTGGAMDDAARAGLEREIERETRAANRMMEDLNFDLQEAQSGLARRLGANMNGVIEKYITVHGFAVVLEVTKGDPPGAWAAASVDITADIVRDYDRAHPVKALASNSYGASSNRPSGNR